jgi:hypothetical protein
VHDYREAAEQAEKRGQVHRDPRLDLVPVELTAAAIWAGAAAVTIADLLYGAHAVWMAAGAGAVVLIELSV